MLNIRNENYKSLYERNVNKEYAVKIEKLKEGEKPSIMSDTMFKTMFYNEKRLKYSAKFISYYLDIDYDKLLKNMKLSKTELDKNKEVSKGYRSDYVADIDDTRINIEVNNNSSKEILERNMDYAFKLYGSKVKRGSKNESYKYNQVIQFNLNNFSFIGNRKIVDIYTLNNNEGLRLSNNIIFIQIYIPNLRKKWYTKGIENLKEEERYALALVEKDILTSKELGGKIRIMEEYIKEAEEVLEDEYFGESYDKEWALKEEGKKEGREEGALTKAKEIAKSLLRNNIDVKIISDSTGLSEKEINSLYD